MSDLARRAAYWRRTILRPGCAMCRRFPPSADDRRGYFVELHRLEAHHICPKQDLRRWGFREDWRVLYDERNGLCLCELHHRRHEQRVHPVPRALLPPGVFEFAAELDELIGCEQFACQIDRDYP